MEKTRETILEKPPGEYRSAPFWGWNDRLEKEELRFQIQEMKEKGMGGFFIHSREGLETPYLSEEWMDAVGTSVKKAEEEELEVWIYDEDKWPSGCAGGLVSRKSPKEFSAKGMTLEVLPLEKAKERKEKLRAGVEETDGKILEVYTAELSGDTILKMKPGIGWEEKTVSEKSYREETEGTQERRIKVLVLRREVSGSSEWYNGYAPTDNLNPEAVKAFLKLTHERYREEFQAQFGRTVKGFFTDEPNVCDFFSHFTKGRPWVTFSDGFLPFFEERRGYSPVEKLPYLFFDGEGCEQLRHDYWRTVAELFCEAYMKQLYEWCEGQGVELTGHMLYENDLSYQARVCGAAMPQYQYLHRPGIDLLGAQTREYLTVKQCTSVAHQYGRKHTITETYGCTGWGFGFEEQKWLGDWQFVMGIDRRCQHLAQYSISGCRKRDYPPVFHYQTTWWEYNQKMEDYFARLSFVSGLGEVVREVLVIHPMSSIWTKCRSKEEEDLSRIEMNMGWLDEHIVELNRWGEEYNRLAEMLLGAHVDFDFGDEMLLEQDGAVKNGRLILKKASYSIVLVPRVVSLFENTGRLLEEFAKQGGKIVWVGEFPKMLEGSYEKGRKAQWEKLNGVRRTPDYEGAVELLRENLKLPVKVTGRNGQEDGRILLMLRKTKKGYVLFAVNNDRKERHQTVVRFPERAKATLFRPWKDQFEEVSVETVGEEKREIRFLAEFSPAESLVWFLDREEEPIVRNVAFPYEHPHRVEKVFAALGPSAKIRRTMENALTLDRCSYSLEQEGLSGEMEVWKAQKEIRERLSMQQVYYNGAPQRYGWIGKPAKGDGTPFCLSFSFEVKETVEGKCFAVVEKSEGFKIALDGEELSMEEGFFLDHSMKRWGIPGLKKGVHVLEIRGKYTLETELEDIYIIGDFSVDTERKIGKERGTLHFGDWTSQGYFHYPGSIVYEFSLPPKEENDLRYFLKMGEYQATLIKAEVNGQEAGILMGNTEKELELTDFLQNEENTLKLYVVGSPRNLLGPFHQSYSGCSRISWEDFRTEGRFYTPEYVVEPYGLIGQAAVIVR